MSEFSRRQTKIAFAFLFFNCSLVIINNRKSIDHLLIMLSDGKDYKGYFKFCFFNFY